MSSCGRCGLEIHSADGVQAFGTHITHYPDRCTELLQMRIAKLEAALEGLEKDAGDIADRAMITGNIRMQSARDTALELLERIQVARAKLRKS